MAFQPMNDAAPPNYSAPYPPETPSSYPGGRVQKESSQFGPAPTPVHNLPQAQPMAGGAPNAGYLPPQQDPVIQFQPQQLATVSHNCPPGLEYLTHLDQLVIKQQVELLEAFTGFETANKYKVLNSLGQPVYFAKEDTGCCNRQCCGPSRQFDMNIVDNSGREVIHLYRPLRCQSCWFPCCLQKLEVHSPPGNLLGTVEQSWSIIYPSFVVKDKAGNAVLKIEGPFCTYSCCGNDVEFKVLSPNGDSELGKISKQWSGLAREAFTDADNFGVSFPQDLDVNVKATLLGAVFLIDFMFFEQAQNKENDGVGMF